MGQEPGVLFDFFDHAPVSYTHLFQADIVFQAAFKSAAHIIVRGSEDHNRFKTELGSFLEGGFHLSLIHILYSQGCAADGVPEAH